MPDASHPVWPIVRSALRVLSLLAIIAVVQDGLSSQDISTLVIYAMFDGSLATAQAVKRKNAE